MLKKSLIALVILAGILFLLNYPKVYVIRGSGGGTVYWNANEAWLFMQAASSGAQMSYPRYALEPFLLAIGDVRSPDDNQCSQTVVIRVTASGIQRFDTDLYRHAEDPYCGFNFDLFEGHIYAVYLPKLWKWSGTQFDLATPTPEELRDFEASRAAVTGAANSHPWEFDNVDGWSMRRFGQTRPAYQLVLNGQPLTIQFFGEAWPQRPVSVDLTRPGQPPQTIWNFDGRPHRVSKAEYETIFGNQ